MAKQQNIQELTDLVALKIPDNFQRLITAAFVREVLNDLLKSYVNIVDNIPYSPYDSGNLYAIGDVVIYLDQLYEKSSSAPAGTEPVNGADWNLLANPFATNIIQGIIRIATDGEAQEGTSETTAVTPFHLANYGGANYTGQKGIEVDNLLSVIKFIGGAFSIEGLDLLVLDNAYTVTTDTQDISFISNNNVVLDSGLNLKLLYDGVQPATGYIPEQQANGVVFVRKPVEVSYRFSQGSTEFPDLLIGGILVTDVQVTVGIATKTISINGGGFINLVNGVSIPANAVIVIKVAYNIGYNGGTVAIKGGVQ